MQEFNHSRRDFLKTIGLSAIGITLPQFLSCKCTSNTRKPNIIIIFCDDLGYGDLGSYGHPTIRTPNLDFICREGQKWTNFYAAASVCTPSRAGLLTGRLPIRNGMCSDIRRVLFPDSAGGLPEDEITIADAVKTQGYATACIGKWHLGHLPRYLPARHTRKATLKLRYRLRQEWMNWKFSTAKCHRRRQRCLGRKKIFLNRNRW